MNRRPILIDTDTASDDAVALIMALRSPAVDVRAITVVAGNCGVEQATSNALYTAELCGSNVPIYTGAAKPLQRELQMAEWFHGQDGLGDHGYAPSLSHRRQGRRWWSQLSTPSSPLRASRSSPSAHSPTSHSHSSIAPHSPAPSPALSSWAEDSAAKATSPLPPNSTSGSTSKPPASSSNPGRPSN